MNQEIFRESISESHRKNCKKKLQIFLEQKKDLSSVIDDPFTDIEKGDEQMKMYNDKELNPSIYKAKDHQI